MASSEFSTTRCFLSHDNIEITMYAFVHCSIDDILKTEWHVFTNVLTGPKGACYVLLDLSRYDERTTVIQFWQNSCQAAHG